LQSTQIHEAATRFKIHQEVNVALGVAVAPGDRSEDPEVSGATFRRQAQDLIAVRCSEFLESHGNSTDSSLPQYTQGVPASELA
jgi:hypothetical protein